MLDVVNGNDVSEVAVGAAKDAASFSKGEGCAAVQIHGFVAAESFHNLGFAQEGDGGEEGDVKELAAMGKAHRTTHGAAHDSRVSETFFSRIDGNEARSK